MLKGNTKCKYSNYIIRTFSLFSVELTGIGGSLFEAFLKNDD